MEVQVMWDENKYNEICISPYTQCFYDKKNRVLFHRDDINRNIVIEGIDKEIFDVLIKEISKPIDINKLIGMIKAIIGEKAGTIIYMLIEQEFLEICR